MISVVIPCYNAAPFIKETIDSIRSQEVEDLEIIVVDDGSSDESAKIIHSIEDDRLIYIHQNNKGVSAARNKGLNHSRGEYIVFFDADDQMPPYFLKVRKQTLENNPNVGFCCGPVVTFPVKGHTTYGIAENVAEGLLTYQPQYSSCPSNYLFRKSILDKHSLLFNEDLSSTADRYFLIELSSKTTGKLTDEVPLLYRVNPDSMSNKLSRKLIIDNEIFFFELKKNNLIPRSVEKEFVFKIEYILGLGFLRTGLYKKGLKYTTTAFFRNPKKFLNQIF